MKKAFFLVFLFSNSFTSFSQNFTAKQTEEYIVKKLKIADPVFYSFDIGDNGETNIKWVNERIFTEYRFNIREVDFSTAVDPEGNNYIALKCVYGTNNCLQRTSREDIALGQIGDRVTYKNFMNLEIPSISGQANVKSIKNALVYLKVLSITENTNRSSAKRDPFLE